MNNQASVRNSGALEQCFGSRGVSVLAGGAGDATLVTGNSIDRFTESGGTIISGAFKVSGSTTLASAETLGVTIGYQTSSNNSDWSTAVYGIGCGANATDYQTIATGVLTTSAVKRFCAIDLSPLPRYIRIVYTPNLSASGTDTAFLVGEFVTNFNTVEDYDNA